jgi:multiple sugar transport system substrate-binding protein
MVNKDQRRKYGILFAVFIFIIIAVLTFNLISLKQDRYPKKSVTKLYFADNMSEAHQKIIKKFNQKHPGNIEVVPVDLTFEKFTTNDRKELIARSLRSRSSRIDIFAVDQIWVPRFAKWSEPLMAYFSEADLAEIVPQALQTCYYQDVLLGIPLYIDLGVLYYRQDLIDKTPESAEIMRKLSNSITWDDLIGYGQTRFPGQPFYLYQGDKYEGLVCNYLEILESMGGKWSAENHFSLNTPAGRQSARFMLDLITKYKVTPSIVSSFVERESYLYALENNAPFFRGWSNFLKDVPVSTADSIKIKNLGVSYLPHFGNNSPASVFGGWNLMISKYSKKKPEAIEFLHYILSEEAQKIMFESSGYLPILKKIYADQQVVTKYPYIKFFKSMMDYGIYRPAIVNYTKISDILAFYLNSILKQDLSVEEAMQRVDQTISSDQIFLR